MNRSFSLVQWKLKAENHVKYPHPIFEQNEKLHIELDTEERILKAETVIYFAVICSEDIMYHEQKYHLDSDTEERTN